MERNKNSFESLNDGCMEIVFICLILAFFGWMFNCKHKKSKSEDRIEKSIKVIEKKWDKWIDKNTPQ